MNKTDSCKSTNTQLKILKFHLKSSKYNFLHQEDQNILSE